MILSHMAPSSFNLREFVKTSVILTPGALLVGCEPRFVLHFAGIRGTRGIAGGVQKSCCDQDNSRFNKETGIARIAELLDDAK